MISLGAGVQSTTMLLMALHGEFGDLPDAAIFADTGYEPKAVYNHLASLIAHVSPYCHYPNATEKFQGEMVIPIHIVGRGNLRADIKRAKQEDHSMYVSLPLYTKADHGGRGVLRRQCTREYKIAPILAHERKMLGLRKGQRIRGNEVVLEQWIGISLDEVQRMKPSLEAWKRHRFPLIEKRMTRWSCIQWLEKHGYPEPPKSACIGCPYHDNRYWRDMRDNRPDEWADAVDFDKMIRRMPRVRAENYIHSSAMPLDEVDLRPEAEKVGQGGMTFDAECEGMCGI